MATNAASYNPSMNRLHWATLVTSADILLLPVGEETGPVSGKPPALSNETKAAVKDAASSSPIGSHVPGEDGEKKVKSEKERTNIPATWRIGCHNGRKADSPRTVERERKKAEKQAKFDQKKAKEAKATPALTSKSKEKKAKAEKKAEEDILPEYVEETPFGAKKSM